MGDWHNFRHTAGNFFLTFHSCFEIPIFSSLNSNSNLLDMRNLPEQVKKYAVTKNCSDLSLFKQIVLVISKFLQILELQLQISKKNLNR